MIKKFSVTVLIVFVFFGCASNINRQQIGTKDFDKLQKVITLVKNYYVEDISKEKYLYTKKRYTNKEDIENEIRKIMDHLDRYSIYINKNNKESITQKAKVITSNISFKIIEKKYLYVLIPYFYKNTAKKLSIILSKHNNLSVILDLRDNPGGYLDESIKTVDLFISRGIIISQVGRNKNLTKTYFATSKSTISSVPMIVLINNKTASSAEIVSGALQDHNRATLIGTQTYGKGTIQALVYITNDKSEAIKLTIGKYYLSSKKTINSKIQANILVKQNNTIKNKDDLEIIEAVKYLDNNQNFIQKAK